MNNPEAELILGVHFHQPAGNFTRILEEAYETCYRPFIDSFRRRSGLKLCLHISSPLLEFFLEKHPDFIGIIREEISRDKIEMIGGGFYEPVLISIPARDIAGQIRMTRDFYKEHLGTDFRGIWLTERVWEPHLPSLLDGTGAEYLALDDTHLIQSGYDPEVPGYFVTEDLGIPLGIFPISKELRYSIPFKPAEKVISFFREKAETIERALFCMLDDGEKFGLWPGTAEWVYGKGWLDKFFGLLEENSGWLKTRTLSEYYDSRRPAGRIYPAATQYQEMRQWSLPEKSALNFGEVQKKLGDKGMLGETDPLLRGGVWRSYFAKYPESDYMHKKMLYLSRELNLLSEKMDPETLEKARKALYKAQCNCPYWHGVFGGLYLPHLRNSVYENLNNLHSILDRTSGRGGDFIYTSLLDMDGDLENEALVDTGTLFICVRKGGIINELSDKRTLLNLLDTVSRRPEAYHKKILDAENKTGEKTPEDKNTDGIDSIHDLEEKNAASFKEHLIYDSYERKTLVDHVLPEGTSFDEFRLGRASGADFTGGEVSAAEPEDGKASVSATRSFSSGGSSLKIVKKLSFSGAERRFDASISIINGESSPASFLYACEFNFGVLTDTSTGKKYIIDGEKAGLDTAGTSEGVRSFGIDDRDLNIRVRVDSDRSLTLWRFPVRAVVNSLEGFELTYQSSSMTALFAVKLGAGETFPVNFKIIIT